MNPLFGVYLLITILLLIALKPRRPWKINAYRNSIFLKVFFAIDIGLAASFTIGSFLFIHLEYSSEFSSIVSLGIYMLFMLLMVYFLYWSQPFSRKRTGVNAIDESIARYKKPNERSIGILGGWCPDLLVDNVAYKLIVYAPENKDVIIGRLAFDIQGKVVQSIEIMDRIEKCYHFALGYINPENINARAAQYSRGEKAQKAWKQMMAKYEDMTSPIATKIGTNMAEHVAKTRISLELFQRYSSDLMDIWMKEAEWGAEHGNTKVKSVLYEDVLKMNACWKEKMSWWLAEIDRFKDGLASAHIIQKELRKSPEMDLQSGELHDLIRTILKFDQATGELYRWKETGEVRDKYEGLRDEEMNLWQSRLKLVEQVDHWISDGRSEKDLVKLKSKYKLS